MAHRHHGLLHIGRRDAFKGHLTVNGPKGNFLSYRRMTCEEYDAYYSGPGWHFFPFKKSWFLAWRSKVKT